MTTMDSDSESQDSDDGRRFRFEATRKDNIQVDAKLRKLASSKGEQESCRNDEKDKSKDDCNRGEHRPSKERDSDSKDLKYSTRYSKHSVESRNLRREDRSARDVSSDSKSSSALSSKHKSRDTKRHKNRDRTEHRSNRSEERGRGKSEDDRAQNEKHRNKSREKYKHHGCDRSREKSYQPYKIRSSDHGKFRGESERYDARKKTSTREDEAAQVQEYCSPKNVGQGHSGNDVLLTGKDFPVESQECKELNLSEFDILSETDENMSDSSDVRNKSSLLVQRSTKTKKRNSNNDYENTSKKQAIEIEPMEGSPKVTARKTDELYGSSNNSSGTISDSTLGATSPIHTEPRRNTADLNSKEEENLNSTKQTSLHLDTYDSVKATEITVSSSHMYTETITTYGPILPPQIATDSSDNANANAESSKDTHFIGPCLPKTDAQDISDRLETDMIDSVNPDNVTQEDSASDTDIFGPALPPHLLKQKSNNETDTKIIGPTLPNTVRSLGTRELGEIQSENEEEEEEEEAIGPLPANHPALQSNYVHRQLEQRAQKMKNEQKDEDYGMLNQREEWMTELPPAQINTLGLTSRKFRIKAGPDMSDRSCWTDTPAKKAEKQKRKEEERLYDVETSATDLSKKSDDTEYWENKKREKSLLEIHQNKLRKKKRKEEKKAKSTGQTIRRPFDRDVDLQVNQFDQARKNAILKKAQHLDERFSRGKCL